MDRHNFDPMNSTSSRSSLFQWIRAKLIGLLEGQQQRWGFARLLTIPILIFLVLAGSYTVEHLLNILTFHPEPNPTFTDWLHSSSGLRAVSLPILVLVLTIFTGGKYISDIYGIKSIGTGIHYVLASTFALAYPYLQISSGKKVLKPKQKNLLNLIGGPGYIDIDVGNAALFEMLTGPSNILGGTRRHFVHRFERIKETADLCDQYDEIELTSAMTRDGIDVTCKDIRYRYRIYTGEPVGSDSVQTPDRLYPFSKRAMFDIAYNRSVVDGEVTPWDQSIKSIIKGEITDYISKHWFDEITIPMELDVTIDPRKAINKRLWSVSTRKKMRDAGAELVWCDIGYFDDPRAEKKRLDLRRVQWGGKSEIRRSEGDAEQEKLQQLGRAEGQADILRSIIHALESINLTQNPRENLRNVFLARTAQVLEAISEHPSRVNENYLDNKNYLDDNSRGQNVP